MVNIKKIKEKINLSSFVYILSNILSYYLLIFFGFLSLIILLQIFRISDLILINGGDIHKIYLILKLLVVITLPIVLPTTFLFAIFLSYKNLREENELIAFASIGISETIMLYPAIAVSIITGVFCHICASEIVPKAHIDSTILENQIKSNFLVNGLRPQIYYDQANFVIYAENKIKNEFINIFIKDKKENTLTTAKRGRFTQEKNNNWFLKLELFDGQTITNRKKSLGNLIRFDESKIYVPLSGKDNKVKLFYLNQTSKEIYALLRKGDEVNKKTIRDYKVELIKRINLTLIPFVFLIIFFAFGFSLHNRTVKSGNFVIGIFVGISYWISYFMFEAFSFASQNFLYLVIPIIFYITFCLLVIAYRIIPKKKLI